MYHRLSRLALIDLDVLRQLMFHFCSSMNEVKAFEYTHSKLCTNTKIYGKKQSDCTLQMPPDDSIEKGILQVTIDSAKNKLQMLSNPNLPFVPILYRNHFVVIISILFIPTLCDIYAATGISCL